FPTNIGDRISIRRKSKLTQNAAIIFVVTRQLPGGERRRFSNPDISLAFGGKRPRDPVATFRSCELGRKGRTHHLFKSEVLRENVSGGQDGKAKQRGGESAHSSNSSHCDAPR